MRPELNNNSQILILNPKILIMNSKIFILNAQILILNPQILKSLPRSLISSPKSWVIVSTYYLISMDANLRVMVDGLPIPYSLFFL